MSGEQP